MIFQQIIIPLKTRHPEEKPVGGSSTAAQFSQISEMGNDYLTKDPLSIIFICNRTEKLHPLSTV